MGDVLRAILPNDPRVPTLSCIIPPKAGTLDEPMSRNVDQGNKPTHWKLAVISSQWRSHDVGEEVMKAIVVDRTLSFVCLICLVQVRASKSASAPSV